MENFFEYFHGDNGRGLGASHQTGWTSLVADLIGGQEVRKEEIVRTATGGVSRAQQDVWSHLSL